MDVFYGSTRHDYLMIIQKVFIMKNVLNNLKHKAAAFFVMLVAFQSTVWAQAQVEVNGNDVGSWFERNWVWVAGGVVLLLLILLLSGGGGRRSTRTTTINRNGGDVRHTTTTTEIED
jgi:hypothetical protein